MKIIKLVMNETIKTLKKTSTKILIILSIIALFASVGFAKGITALNNYGMAYTNEEYDWREDLNTRLSYMRKSIEESNNYNAQAIAQTKALIETYEFALDNDIRYEGAFNYNYWKRQAVEEMQLARTQVLLYESTKYLSKEQKKDKEEKQALAEARRNLVLNDNFEGYMELLKKEQKDLLEDKKIEEDEYEDNIYLLNIKQKCEIYRCDGQEYSSEQNLYYDIESIVESLRTGLNPNTGKLLKPDEVKKMEDSIKVDLYKIEHDIPTVEVLTNERTIYDTVSQQFSMLMVSLLMIIIAGSAISSEISKGTIKFVLFTPNKRWKILFAKVTSAILILLCLTIVLSLLSALIGNLCFEQAGNDYIYVKDGEVRILPYMNYVILYFLALCIDVLVYMFFAFMLSTVTRNTALSVGLSVACYVGSGIVMNIVNSYIKADWVKYIPFNNFGIADKIFTNTLSYTMMESVTSLLNNVSIWFSLGVLGVTTLLMIITMFDSFNKRDIV